MAAAEIGIDELAKRHRSASEKYNSILGQTKDAKTIAIAKAAMDTAATAWADAYNKQKQTAKAKPGDSATWSWLMGRAQ